MRKLFALLLVAGMFTVVSCEEKKTEETVTEIETTETTVDTTSTTEVAADTTVSTTTDTTVTK